MPENFNGIFFIEPEDEDFKNIMKKARRKLDIPMPAAMPCKTPINSGGETYYGIGKSKTKHACIVEAEESTRIRLERASFWYHEDHIAAKGINSSNHYNLVHKIIPMPQAVKNTGCEGCSGKNWKNGKDTSMAAVIDEARHQGRKVHFASLMDLCRLKNRSWIQSTKAELCCEVTLGSHMVVSINWMCKKKT